MSAIRPGQVVYWNDEEGVWFSKEMADTLYQMLKMAAQADPETDRYGNEHCAVCKAERTDVPIYSIDEDGEETDEVMDWKMSAGDFDHEAWCPQSSNVGTYWLRKFPSDPRYRPDWQPALPGIRDLEEMTTE